MRALRTASARRWDRSLLCAALPTLSVWPSISALAAGKFFKKVATFWSWSLYSGLTTSLSVSNWTLSAISSFSSARNRTGHEVFLEGSATLVAVTVTACVVATDAGAV